MSEQLRRGGVTILFVGCAFLLGGCETQVPSTPSVLPATTPLAQRLPTIAAGNYAITVVADCSIDGGRPVLPVEFRKRTYLARLEQDATDVKVVVKESRSADSDADPELFGRIQTDGSVTLTSSHSNDFYDVIWTQLTKGQSLGLRVEQMTLTFSAEGLPTARPFDGSVYIYELASGEHSSSCDSATHSVTFERRPD